MEKISNSYGENIKFYGEIYGENIKKCWLLGIESYLGF